MEEILRSGFAEMGICADNISLEAFESFFELLEEGGKTVNLTAVKGEEDTARLHFLDCCALLKAADFRCARVIDVGTGAGFPGIPLKIAEPSADLTLMDAQLRRAEFLQKACAALKQLGGTRIICARAEEAPPDMREYYDIAVSRAVARMNVLCEICLPFVREGGLFIAMKGSKWADELREASAAISELGGEFERTYEYLIPGTDIRHAAVIIRKKSPAPEKYPRRWAKIIKKPL